MTNTENALRQILAAARGLERGEENPREVAQNIQLLVCRALADQPPPDLFLIDRNDDGDNIATTGHGG